MIQYYFDEIEKTILHFAQIIRSYSVNKKVYNRKQGFIKGEIFFVNDSQLHFIEVKNIEVGHKDKYRYHYMNKNNDLIFRYDNASHHHEIETFPHHKHSGDRVEKSQEPTLRDILIEIHEFIKKTSYDI